jgi:hypothetical protein
MAAPGRASAHSRSRRLTIPVTRPSRTIGIRFSARSSIRLAASATVASSGRAPPAVSWLARGVRQELQHLVGVGKRRCGSCETIQLRETSGDLSGSGSETHQHFSPTGASCRHSLLLDPDVRIGIDLHKRLFLLVTA